MKFIKSLSNLFNSDPTFVGVVGPTLIKELASPRPKPETILNVLVAEDNLADQYTIVAQLKKLGFEASPVVNGQEAIDALSCFAYDLILMDCQMPKLNGYQTIAAIRRGEAGIWGSKTPVIAITGTKENFKKCVVAGMDDCLLKPLEISQLEGCIRRFLQNKADPNFLPENVPGSRDKYAGVSPEISRIDATALAKLQMLQIPGENDVLSELVEIFVKTTPQYLAGMKNALDHQDLSLLSQGAHAVKSSSGSLGANWVREIALRLEMIGGSDSIEEATRLMERLEIEFEYAKIELKNLVKKNSESPISK
ncbi:MAG: response regulator [Bdellovibrionia bacterium]